MVEGRKINTKNAKEMQLKSAKKRSENKIKRKLLSQIYTEFLTKKYDVEFGKKISGADLCNEAIKKIIERGDSASVAIMREIREATEGQKINVKNTPPLNINLSGALLSADDMQKSSEVEICQPEEN